MTEERMITGKSECIRCGRGFPFTQPSHICGKPVVCGGCIATEAKGDHAWHEQREAENRKREAECREARRKARRKKLIRRYAPCALLFAAIRDVSATPDEAAEMAANLADAVLKLTEDD